MQALILAGGKGTRLQPYTTVLPKPLMPVGEYPILEIILRQLKQAGFDEVILAIGYMGQLFESRPLPRWSNYETPISGLYLCGAGMHPGGAGSGVPRTRQADMPLSCSGGAPGQDAPTWAGGVSHQY